ncbi:MYND-type zinc finger-containing chromatin reader ZMYND8 isoform X27 [Bos taurus]|uniref:MYND-type zinc finger-containing chromatin reader ZMYND8 isoform X27 n=1 Tax=Bos taurus TaxID=9913 RepID=UPI000D53A5E5|nr:MYND-type zinc finger-containing chromatin reader ZMYND8 isoform X27 [Bos taurus]
MADSKAGKFTSKEVLGRPDSVLAREDVCLKQNQRPQQKSSAKDRSWVLGPSLAEEEIKTEQEVVEGMDISTRSKDPGSTERTAQKRKFPSPPHSSNGHSPQDTSTSPIKKKKKPGLLNNNNKEQSELRHGPFYYMKQPLTTDPVDVVPQDGRNDFYCWVCHREGQVLCCELCPRVYHAKCLRLTSEPEGDWFCPECEKITVAECIETQSKAMTMLTIEQLSYLLKFAIQKMKQPGTDAFQKPVPLEQHPDYAEYIFHPMDLCTLEKNAKKKMYGCTEAFLADAKWILHNCIIYNGASPASTKTGQAGSLSGSPKPFSPQVSTPVTTKTDKTSTTGSILNLNLDRSKAEMDLKELSESVQQQSAPVPLISPKRQIRSRFQLNLDKTIESCKAQLGINEISEDVYTAVEHSDSEDSEKSDSSGSDSISDEEQRSKNEPEDAEDKEGTRMDKEPSAVKKKPKLPNPVETKEELKGSTSPASEKADPSSVKEKTSPQPEKDFSDKAKPSPHPTKDKLKGKDETDSPTVHLGLDSDSESELVIDLGEDHSGREGRKNKKEPKEPSPKQEVVGKAPPSTTAGSQSPPETPVLTRSSSQTPTAGVTASTTSTVTAPAAAAAAAAAATTTGSPVKKQRPLLPKETAPAVQRVVWNSSSKFQTSSQKWHMQKMQRQQQQQQQQSQQQQQPQSSQGTRYQTRQAVKAVQQKEITQSPSTSTITLVTSTQSSPLVTSSGTTSTLASSVSADLPIATASADVAADIAKYTSKMMDAIKGTMTEIYNDLSKNTTGSTIAEIRRLRIEIEKLQWLHQQELSEMKHNLELTMAEMRQSLEQERDRLIAEVKKQLELEKQQAVDETKKKQWCANCKKEAIFYCCWNTSYCDYPCQQAHWPEHMKSCTQSATAPQPEADPEVNTETLTKSSQGASSSTQAAPAESSASKEKETPAEKSKDGGSTLDLSGSRETPSSILLGSNQGSVSNRCDKQPASAPTSTDHQPHPNYPAQKYHSRSSKSSCWSGSEEKRGSARSEHNAGTSSKSLIPKESRLDTFWD